MGMKKQLELFLVPWINVSTINPLPPDGWQSVQPYSRAEHTWPVLQCHNNPPVVNISLRQP